MLSGSQTASDPHSGYMVKGSQASSDPHSGYMLSGSQTASDPHSGYMVKGSQASSDPHSGYMLSGSQAGLETNGPHSDPQLSLTQRLANFFKAMEELIRGTTDVHSGYSVLDSSDPHSGYMLTDSKTSDPHSGYVAASTLKQHNTNSAKMMLLIPLAGFGFLVTLSFAYGLVCKKKRFQVRRSLNGIHAHDS